MWFQVSLNLSTGIFQFVHLYLWICSIVSFNHNCSIFWYPDFTLNHLKSRKKLHDFPFKQLIFKEVTYILCILSHPKELTSNHSFFSADENSTIAYLNRKVEFNMRLNSICLISEREKFLKCNQRPSHKLGNFADQPLLSLIFIWKITCCPRKI